ncbi:TIGR04283 family arsenosugar biosynthesis glycosyltransferase [Desulfobacula phenolica]|uniref:Transferase 2, rSAM/selenodomain-associated n=1 Tax=Desulfobacula phenolica TaxID=90732 RepID=A0A1H2HAT1_9BACT|nr:TIGR04283 family arsenosugar biosynthesis glycosyltransferase [Desulfobacula phenolica]SDU28902.1 transferase 2, rSAM/selenodomain-associated [Desulfobacula phenolica]
MKTDISIIIPVLNEQEGINQAIEKIYQQDFSGTLEVIVVDGGKNGSTICCVKNKDVITVVSPLGRGCQMNSGARMASGNILLFLHCDTSLPEGGLNAVQTVMENLSVKAGAFDLSIAGRGFFYRMVEKTASLRSRITRIPYGDQAVFIRKNYFFDIGQYREIPIMEDVDLMVRIKQDKGRLKFINTRTSTSSRRWEQEGRIYGTLRNWAILTLFFLGVKPEKLAGVYKIKGSNKGGLTDLKSVNPPKIKIDSSD